MPFREAVSLFLATAGLEAPPEARDRDVGLMAVLLKKHPLQDPGTFESRARYVRCALDKVEEGGVGFGNEATVCKLQKGDPAVRILGQEIR